MQDSHRRAKLARDRAVDLARSWGPVAAWMMVIFLLSGRPDDQGDLRVGVVVPKLAHIVEYAILGFLLARATRNEDEAFSGQRTFLIVMAIGLYAASDELHQAFVPSREARVTDVLIDVAGGLLGLLAWRAVARSWRRPRL
jgi:VanZ family protein